MRTIHPQVQRVLDGPAGPEVAAFFDFDGTVIDGFSVAALYKERLRKFDVGPLELLQLISALGQSDPDEEQFTMLAEQAAAVWKGRDEADLTEFGRRVFVQRIGETLFLDAWEVVQAHKRMGHTLVFASAASRFQLEPMAEELGVDDVLCTQFEEVDGMLTGKLAGPPLWGSLKAAAVREYATERGLDLSRCYGYGNGDEDINFLQQVGIPCAVNAQPLLAAHADREGWTRVHFEARGRSGPTQLARSAALYGSIAASGTVGMALSLVNRNRRQGVDLATGLMGDLSLAVAGVDLNVQGREHLWSHRPAVFIMNHQSSVDMPVMMKLIREGFTGVAKKELASAPGFGQFFRWAGVAFVDRGNSQRAREALAPVVTKLQEGISIVIAPEGTRSPTPRLGPFKKGAFHLAMQAGVPIVPVVIRNAGEIAWRDSMRVRPGTIDVLVLPPVSVADWTLDDLDDRVAGVRQQFVDALADWPEPAGARA
jgi:putative phosphoserine phosphatase/1-acylglycerol-3-phosphate O-acyltransferase